MIKVSFCIKTYVTSEHGESFAAYSKEFENYPTIEQIAEEVDRLKKKGYSPCFSSVEKRYNHEL